MKALRLFLICCLGILTEAVAQQAPQFTNYLQNDFLVNPAAAGKKDHFDLSLLNRYQWVGIQDAPRTFIVTVAGPNKKNNMGFGGQIFTDIVGPTRRIGGRINYAYHMKLGQKIKLSFGAYVGLLQYGIDASKIRLGITDIPDIIGTNYQRSLVPDLGAGAYLYQKDKFYVGLAFPQVLKYNLKFERKIETNSQLSTLIAAHGGYTFDLGNKMAVEPSALMKFEAGAPINLNMALKFIYDKQHWLGAMYKSADGYTNQYAKDLFKQNNISWVRGESVAMMVGMTFRKYLTFGYSYDYTISRLATYNTGSHEVIVTLMINQAAQNERFKKTKKEQDAFDAEEAEKQKELEKQQREEAKQKAKEAAEKKAAEEKAAKEAADKAAEEAKQKAKDEEEKKAAEEKAAKEAADRAAEEAKLKEKEEADKKAKEAKEAADKAKEEEAKKKELELKEKKMRIELDQIKKNAEKKKLEEEKAKKAAEEKAKKDAELKAIEDARIKAKEAADKKLLEEKKAKEAIKLKEKEAADKKAKEAADALEKERKAKEAVRLKEQAAAAEKVKKAKEEEEAVKKKAKEEADKIKAAELAEKQKAEKEAADLKKKEKEALDKQREEERLQKKKEEELKRKEKAGEKKERDEEKKKQKESGRKMRKKT